MTSILQQASFLFTAQVLIRIVSFFYMIFLARTLGVVEFGLFSTALAYFALSSAVVDFGFNRYLIREVAKNNAKDISFNITLLRLTLFAIFFAVMSVLLYIFDPNKMRVIVVLLSMLALFPLSVAQTFDGVLIALGRIKISAISLLVLSISTTVAGTYLVWSQYGALGGAVALIIGHLVYLLFLLIVLSRKQMLKISNVKSGDLKEIFLGVLPYGVLGILGLVYFRIDTLLLNYLKGDFETGIYTAGYKFLESSFFIPSVLATVLFPQFAKFHVTNQKEELRRTFYTSVKFMTLVGLSLTFLLLFASPFLIPYLLPGYEQSVAVIQILSIAIPFMFAHSVSVQLLFSTDKLLKTIIYLSLITVSFNILVNLLAIPQFGFIGAAWVTVLSEILSFVIFFALILHKKLI